MSDQAEPRGELREFVRESLVEIAGAIIDAQDQLKSGGTRINPEDVDYNVARSAKRVLTSDDALIQDIDFDIAVTATRESGGGKLGIKVLGVELGGEKGGGATDSVVSHIRFSVPVVFRTAPK